MIIKQTVVPAEEPVSVAEAKTHLRVDVTDDDALIGRLVSAAREYLEQYARRAFVTQTWRLSLDEFPAEDEIVLPKPPLQSVSSIVSTDFAGTATTFSSASYTVDSEREPGRVVLNYNESWPSDVLATANPVQVTFVAGYGAAADVPERWKQAILLLVGHWYENREAIVSTGAIPKALPLAVQSLVLMDRVW